MSETKKQFAGRLIAADPPSPKARERFEKEIRAMLETRLTPWKRGLYLAGGVVLMLLGAFIGWGAWSPPVEPVFLIYISVYGELSALALLIVGGLLVRASWKGTVANRTSRKWAAGVGVVYVGLIGWVFMVAARHIPELVRDDMRVLGLVLMMYAAVGWVRHQVAQAELRTAERLLEIELRLAEIGEACKPPSLPPPPP